MNTRAHDPLRENGQFPTQDVIHPQVNVAVTGELESDGDAAMIAGYVGKSEVLDEAMVKFAFAYADQTEKDYQALFSAAKSGRIKVASASE